MAGETVTPRPTPPVRELLRTAGGRWAVGLPFAVAVAAAFAPLADHLGFEFALALTIASALAAPAGGAAWARITPLSELSWRVGAGGAVLGLAALVAPVAVIAANALRRPPCEPVNGLVWLLLLPVPTALVSGALGAWARFRTGRTRDAALLVGSIELASLGVNLWSLYSGPGFFVFDHFFGYFPGPLYDESVLLTPAVLLFRGLTLCWALVVVAACGAARERSMQRRLAVFAGLTLLALSLAFGDRLGFRTSDAHVARTLGGLREEGPLEIHHPIEWTARQVDQFAAEAAFRRSQVVQALQLTESAQVRIWVYRSADEKRLLTGAGATSFAKPWRHEIHIQADAHPHPVLRHELVHALAADLAEGPFRTPGGLLPNSPLIEGLAVAYDAEPDGMTLMQWARCLRDLKLAPDIGALFSSSAFLTSAPSRAYTHAGAFIRYLAKSRGDAAVATLYRTGNLAALGDPASLVKEFEAALDDVAVGPAERALAERRFSRPSVFHRHCGREVSTLTDRARELLLRNDVPAATRLYEEACAMEPDDPQLLRALLKSALKARDESRWREVAGRLLAHPKIDASLRAGTLMDLGDEEWRLGRVEQARERFAQAAKLSTDPATHRSAVIRERAVLDGELGSIVRPLLADGDTSLGVLLNLSDRVRARPDDAVAAYLLGRQLAQRDLPERALGLLTSATADGLSDDELRRETLRLRVRALADSGRCDEAERESATASALSDLLGGRDWAARCRFAKDRAVRGR